MFANRVHVFVCQWDDERCAGKGVDANKRILVLLSVVAAAEIVDGVDVNCENLVWARSLTGAQGAVRRGGGCVGDQAFAAVLHEAADLA